MNACTRAFDAFDDARHLAAMRQTAMARRFTWAEPAAAYAALYGRVAGVTVPLGVARPVPAAAGHSVLEAGRQPARARSRTTAAEKALEPIAATIAALA
jgi:hypothetical protein